LPAPSIPSITSKKPEGFMNGPGEYTLKTSLANLARLL
jgi:hypothetical protein